MIDCSQEHRIVRVEERTEHTADLVQEILVTLNDGLKSDVTEMKLEVAALRPIPQKVETLSGQIKGLRALVIVFMSGAAVASLGWIFTLLLKIAGG